MTNKPTDAEIIKALECCFVNSNCNGCPQLGKSRCLQTACENALDLINRYQAENERLKKDNEYILMQHKFQRRPDGDCWNDVIEKAKAEAIKEFAERLKSELLGRLCEYFNYELTNASIDKIVKEMVGDTDA